MIAPFSHYRFITPWLITLSIILSAALTILPWVLQSSQNYDVMMLWVSWVVAGLLSFIIWNTISRFNLQGGSELKAFAISWPLLTAGCQFTYCHYPHFDYYPKALLQMIVLMVIVSINLSLWQRRHSTLKHLLLGTLIGGISTLLPHTILWLLLMPVASYYMRSWSARNLYSTLTGAAFAIWVVYCIRFLLMGIKGADQLFEQYAIIIADEDLLAMFTGFSLWQYLYLGITLLLVIFYSISGLLLGIGQSIRAGFSIQLLSMLSIILIVLLTLDAVHLFSNLNMLVLFITTQLTIHQANVRSIMHEWWILLIIITYCTLCLLPIVL